MASEGDTVLLYDHPVSSYAQKVRIALREKNVAFTARVPDAIKIGKPESEFVQANPRLEVPTLIDGDVQILDSTIILEYIEDKWPEPALLPKGPADRAKARMIEEICDTHYEAINWGWGEIMWFHRATGELAEQMKAKAVEQTLACQEWLSSRLGTNDYFGGSHFGWADVCAAAVVNRSRYYGIGMAGDTPLGKWLARISERPSVKETFAEFDALVGKMAAMSNAFESGERKREYRDHRLEWVIKSGGIDIVQEGLQKNNLRFSWP